MAKYTKILQYSNVSLNRSTPFDKNPENMCFLLLNQIVTIMGMKLNANDLNYEVYVSNGCVNGYLMPSFADYKAFELLSELQLTFVTYVTQSEDIKCIFNNIYLLNLFWFRHEINKICVVYYVKRCFF